ncbi:MAG: hypothetical protein RL150_530 [Candidatus Parcubacteria bacterium]|jgi:branched-chain amino acid transport system substrate-binding protein
MKKIGYIIIAVVVIGLIVAFKPEKQAPTTQTIAAVLPLSGPAALWGENVKNGMELALKNHPELSVVYADSEGKPAEGVSAFRSVQEKNPIITLSILSSVTVPLSKIAAEESIPLFATLTAANDVANEFTIRHYSNASDFAGPAFFDETSPVQQAETIALLYRNDELGKSVAEKVAAFAVEKGKKLILQETFTPGETDFGTAMTKVKASTADVLLFVPVAPSEATGIVKASQEVQLNVPLVETCNVFADMEVRKQVAGTSFHSNVYPFSLPGNAMEFKKQYADVYGKEPNFAAAYGYDAVTMIAACKDAGEDVISCLKKPETFTGITGTATQITPGDFNVPLQLNKVE